MPIRFACRRCDHVNEVPSTAAGNRVACGRCLEDLTVPVPKPRPAPPAPAPTPPSGASSRMVRFACPRCGHTNEAPASAAGRSASCGRCLEDLTIPAAAGSKPAPAAASEPRPAPPSRPVAPAALAPAPKPRPTPPPRPIEQAPAPPPQRVVARTPPPPPPPAPLPPPAAGDALIFDEDATEGEAPERLSPAAGKRRRAVTPKAAVAKSRRPSRDPRETLAAFRPHLEATALLLAIGLIPLMIYVAPDHLSPKGLMTISWLVGGAGIVLANIGSILTLRAIIKDNFVHLFLMVIPFYALYYLVTRWNQVARPYLAILVGGLLPIVPAANSQAPQVVAQRQAEADRKEAERADSAARQATAAREDGERKLAARMAEPPPTVAEALPRMAALNVDRSLVPVAELRRTTSGTSR